MSAPTTGAEPRKPKAGEFHAFRFDSQRLITGYHSVTPGGDRTRAATRETSPLLGTTNYRFDDGDSANPDDNPDLFYCFQLSKEAEGSTIIEASQVEAALPGGEDTPDVAMRTDLLAFHVGADEDIDRNTRATLRMIVGKDDSSQDDRFEQAFWAIAAGLNLFDSIKNKPTEPKELKGSFHQALGRRPIEVPGGLAQLSFEVVKHEEPKWWQKIFRFLGSDVGKTLISVIGFPAVANQAIALLDEALDKLDGSKPKVLFKGGRMQLALTHQAREDFTSGNPRVKIGVLNPGISVLARGRDFQTVANAKASYWATYGKLVPDSVKPEDVPGNRYDDPFEDVTYAVIRVGMQSRKLDPNFNFGGNWR
jgi:hypothetical protein